MSHTANSPDPAISAVLGGGATPAFFSLRAVLTIAPIALGRDKLLGLLTAACEFLAPARPVRSPR